MIFFTDHALQYVQERSDPGRGCGAAAGGRVGGITSHMQHRCSLIGYPVGTRAERRKASGAYEVRPHGDIGVGVRHGDRCVGEHGDGRRATATRPIMARLSLMVSWHGTTYARLA